MLVPTLQWILLRLVFCTILFPERSGNKFEDAMAVTGLEDVHDG